MQIIRGIKVWRKEELELAISLDLITTADAQGGIAFVDIKSKYESSSQKHFFNVSTLRQSLYSPGMQNFSACQTEKGKAPQVSAQCPEQKAR